MLANARKRPVGPVADPDLRRASKAVTQINITDNENIRPKNMEIGIK